MKARFFDISQRFIFSLLFIFLFVFSISRTWGQTTNFTTVGTTTWTVPAGVTCITVECWGGGGAGGANNDNLSFELKKRGGGGGGGAYSRVENFSVTPGQTYTVVVGAGGTGNLGGSTATSGNGGNGGISEFKIGTNIYCSAAGGAGGAQGWTSTAAVGGNGGASGVGFLYAGGKGANASTGSSMSDWKGGGGGGGGGPSGAGATPTTYGNGGLGNSPGGNGGNGGNTTTPTTGNAGLTIGGGGGGAGAVTGNETSYRGGNGARGEVRVTVCTPACTPPTSVTLAASATTLCAGGSTNFTTSLSGGSLGGGNWEYQFELTDGTVLQPWSTTSTFNPSGIGAATYNVIVKVRSSACNTTSTTSNTVVVTVNTISVAPISITGTNTICAGSSTTLTTNGGSLGYEAEDLWYAGSCPTECFTQEWATQPYASISGMTVNSVSNGILNVSSTSNDPMISMDGLGSFDPATCRYINIRYRVISGTANNVEIFFYNTAHAFAVGGETGFGSLISDNTWRTVSVDMWQDPDYLTGGNITGWRFDWATANGVNMEIDFISLSSSPLVGTGTTFNASPNATTTYFTLKKGACNTTSCVAQTVTVTPLPTTSNAGSTLSTCLNTGVTLQANTPINGTGQWSVSSGPNTSTAQFSNTTAPNAVFTPTQLGSYVLAWTISNGSCSPSVSTVTINVNNPIINPITGTTSIACGQTSTLSATLSGTYGPTGGTITTSGAYTIHTFTSSGDFVVPAGFTANADYLIVAGGGGGGAADNYYSGGAGGGGAGGMRTGSTAISAQTYPIVVGTGGAGGTGGASSVASQGTRGSNGTNSSFNSISATGGGGGGAPTNKPGLAGGSGGGAYYSASGGTGISGQGNNGGLNTSANGSSGGGGAGAAGASTSNTNAGGAGGIGLQSSITGTAVYYAGGGGGGGYSSNTGGAGGLGGGGTAPNAPGVGGAGTNGLGGGGAGASGTGNFNGGKGGDGVVIIRYIYSPPTGTWSSSNTAVATVDPNTGVVTAVSGGTATISYTVNYNGCPSTVQSTVTVSGCASITTGTIASSFCEGSTFDVPYAATGTYNAGNVFTAQLSDANGSFASPTVIGTLTSTSSGTISATLPNNISGSGYLIRVVSSNPAIIGSTTAAFSIAATPSTASVNAANLNVCGSLTSGSLGGNTPAVGTGAWSIVSGPSTGSFSLSTSPSSTFTANAYGTYVLRWTVSNPPCADASATVTVNFGRPVTWGNVQFPFNGTINACQTFDVYGRVYGLNVTEANGGNVIAELGWSTTNSNPNTWTNWIPANFNVQSGNDDEYLAVLNGATLGTGTFYYAYRYSTVGCTSYIYGGTSGLWNNNSGVLTVTSCDNFGIFASAPNLFSCNTTVTSQGPFYNTTGTGADRINTTTGTNFTGYNYGSYFANSGGLILRGGEIKTFKTSSGNVCSGRMYYRVYSGAPTGAFTAINLPFYDQCNAGAFPTGGGCNNGDQKWQSVTAGIDLTTLAPGSYSLEVYFEASGSHVSTSGCESTVFANNSGNNFVASFTIVDQVSASNTGPYCVGQTIQLNGSSNTSPSWTGPVSFSNSTQNPTRPTATEAMSGEYIFSSTLANGCSQTASTFVTVSTSALANNSGPVCVGGALNLTSSTGTSYAWSGPNSFSSSAQNPSVSASATTAMAGTYTVSIVGACGSSGGVVDNFSDGNFTANPVWTVRNGGWQIYNITSTQYLYGNNDATQDRITTPSTQAYGTWEFDYSFQTTTSSASQAVRFFLISSATTLEVTNGYYVHIIGDGNIYLRRMDASSPSNPAIIISGTWTANTSWHSIRVVRRFDNHFELYRNNILIGTTSTPDATYTTSSVIGFWNTGAIASDNHRVDNISTTPPAIAQTTVVVNNPTTPTFTQVPAICSGATLSALPTTSTNGITGSWSPALNNNTTTTYTFTPNSGQCGTTAEMTISVNAAPSLLARTSTLCSGNAYNLSAIAGDNILSGTTYSWSFVANPNLTGTSSGTNQSSFSQTLTNNSDVPQTVVYSVTPSAGGCSGAPFAITLTVKPALNGGTISTDQTICAGASAATLTSTQMPSGGNGLGLANSVLIGTQIWMNKNLEVVNYNDGTAVGTNFIGTDGAYSWYNNSYPTWGQYYGPLYNWYAVNTGKLCPQGWHVPTKTEWNTLISTAGGSLVAGQKLKSCRTVTYGCPTTQDPRWDADANDFGTDDFGFSALPAGRAYISSGNLIFERVRRRTRFWASTQNDASNGDTYEFNDNSSGVNIFYHPKDEGYSVRCMGDNATNIQNSYAYQWQQDPGCTNNWTNISGANGLTYSPGILTQTTCFRRVTTDGCGTVFSNIITITVNPAPAVTNMATTICSGATFNVTPVNGTNGTVPTGTTYTWSAPVINPANAVTGGSAQATAQPSISQTLSNTTTATATATYTVTPSAGACPGSTFTVTVTINPNPTPTISGNTPLCAGASITLTSSSASSYAWTPNGETSQSITVNAAGTYGVTVTDANGCTGNTSVQVTNVAPATIQLITSP